MFSGRFFHTIDGKGRLSIPSRYRDELAQRGTDTLVLTEGDHCVMAYPLDEWERFVEKLREQPQFAPEMRSLVRVIVGSAKECPVDRAGRTLVPPELREFAGLQKDIVIQGTIKHFEIWNRDRWTAYHQRIDFDESARKASEFGL